jgi:hypothetical protein
MGRVIVLAFRFSEVGSVYPTRKVSRHTILLSPYRDLCLLGHHHVLYHRDHLRLLFLRLVHGLKIVGFVVAL